MTNTPSHLYLFYLESPVSYLFPYHYQFFPRSILGDIYCRIHVFMCLERCKILLLMASVGLGVRRSNLAYSAIGVGVLLLVETRVHSELLNSHKWHR